MSRTLHPTNPNGTGYGRARGKASEKSFPSKPPYSPYAGETVSSDAFIWGDTHLHTSYSMDAGAFGARLGPKDAYVFAKGNEITASSGQRVKLSRPLDFLVVADHSDGMGFFPMLLSGEPRCIERPARQEMVRNDSVRQGSRRGVRHHHHVRQGTDAQSISFRSRALPHTAAPGRRPSRQPRRRTIRAASPPSSASSGRRIPAATTCTATSFSETTRPRRALSNPTQP